MSTEKGGVTVFYSWQSDLPSKTNRGLIRDALEGACKDLSAGLEEPVRVDSDTQGVPGAVDIAATIFEKIEKADVFVADVSIIGTAKLKDEEKGRPVPNPNVMIELGYAKRALGVNRVVMVCNTAYGEIERLPFDIRGKSVMAYSFQEGEDGKPAGPRNELRGKLKAAISAALEAARERAVPMDPDAVKQEQKALKERLEALRRQRVEEVLRRWPPPSVPDGLIMVVQLIPAVSLDGEERVDPPRDYQKVLGEMRPDGANSWRETYDSDSVTTIGSPPGRVAYSYVRLFQDGSLQFAVPAAQLRWSSFVAVRALAQMAPAMSKLGLPSPYFVALDVLRASGQRIDYDDNDWRKHLPGYEVRSITQDNLSPPGIPADTVSRENAAALLKPALDKIWRAAGHASCFDYDSEGRYLNK